MKENEVRASSSVPWRLLAGLSLLNLALGIWYFVRSFSFGHAARVDIAPALIEVLYPLAMALLCLYAFFSIRATIRAPAFKKLAGQSLVPLFLGLGLLVFTLGAGFWLYQFASLHRPPDFPSLTYYLYFGMYPFFLLAMLLLPSRKLSPLARLRIFLDTLITMAAVTILCYVMGPVLVRAHEGLLGKIVGGAYPLWPISSSCAHSSWSRCARESQRCDQCSCCLGALS